MRHAVARSALVLALALGAATAGAFDGKDAPLSAAERQTLQQTVASPQRTPANVLRDKYRHPLETLAFFGVRPGDTVVEMWPGGGWYTEILAPYVERGGGTYYAVAPDKGLAKVRELAAAKPDLYGHIRAVPFPIGSSKDVVPAASADVVLTFRNVHNWQMGDKPFAADAFRQIYAMLKPGGVLGVVDHRLPENADVAREKSSGYVKVSTVRRLAEQAGFRFAGASKINDNPKDTADWPNGVWTLPPVLQGGDVDREKYLAIGESDRMTLKFVKPR
ncbi:MAG: methyltransferase [Alphaproteobacteria bacterium]|nr:methyltransferase [Alphaproteobacteria bacterium]